MSVLTKFIRIISNYRAFGVIPLATLKLEKAALKAFPPKGQIRLLKPRQKSFRTRLRNFVRVRTRNDLRYRARDCETWIYQKTEKLYA